MDQFTSHILWAPCQLVPLGACGGYRTSALLGTQDVAGAAGVEWWPRGPQPTTLSSHYGALLRDRTVEVTRKRTSPLKYNDRKRLPPSCPQLYPRTLASLQQLHGPRVSHPASTHSGSRYLFCVVTTTVVFVDVNVVELLDFFQENGSWMAISDSSPLMTLTSRNRPITKLEKQSRRSSLQRPEFLEKTKSNLVLVINKTSGSDRIPFCTCMER